MKILLGLTLAVFVTGLLSACQTSSYPGVQKTSHHLKQSKGRDD